MQEWADTRQLENPLQKSTHESGNNIRKKKKKKNEKQFGKYLKTVGWYLAGSSYHDGLDWSKCLDGQEWVLKTSSETE
jgi:hypothetical protein